MKQLLLGLGFVAVFFVFLLSLLAHQTRSYKVRFRA